MSEYHDMALCDLRPLNSPAAIRDRGSRRPPDRATAGTVCAPPGKEEEIGDRIFFSPGYIRAAGINRWPVWPAEVYRPFRLVWRTFRSFVTTEEPGKRPGGCRYRHTPGRLPLLWRDLQWRPPAGILFRKPAGMFHLILQLFL